MHILHFMNIPLDISQLTSGGSEINHGGGWMAVLIRQLLQETDLRFTCVSFGKTPKLLVTEGDRINSVVIPEQGGVQACQDLVDNCNPDLIHIHGTEGAYGLLSARGLVQCPVVISLQGLLGPCSEWYHYFGNRNLKDIIRMYRWLEIFALRGQLRGFVKTRNYAKRELEIITGNRFFMGRTEWDRAYIRACNPSAHYFHGGELLREAFWQKQWDVKRVKRHRVIFTNAGHPRKGTEVLLDAVKILKPIFPDIQICIAGSIRRRSGYGRYLRHRISGLVGSAVELGQLNAEEMAKEMLISHAFISPSFIDNSPNAVCEAQLLGMPVVSSYTGGVPSLIEDRRTGLFFPTGDVPMLVAKIREIFENDELAVKLGRQARSHARQRHDPDVIVREIVTTYEDILRIAP
jgi:glycosyltransferase involved in cell wall biosynthesis